MSKTITIYDYIASELQNRGHNEFVNDEGKWVAFDKKYQFIQKMMAYDSDVSEIVDEIFLGATLENSEDDNYFKRLFLLYFMEREIAYQSFEVFSSKLVFVFLANQSFIQNVLSSAEDFISMTQRNNQESSDESESTNTTDNRNAYADLPQNKVNIDLNDDTLEYATNNTISKNTQGNESKNQSSNAGETKTFQLDNLIKSQGLLKPVFDNMDSKCFLQIW